MKYTGYGEKTRLMPSTMMERLLYSVGKKNGREGPNLHAGNNNKKSRWKNKTTTFINKE
jgi:hypothetical protein